MKILKPSLTSIIAFLTISTTIVAQEGLFKAKKIPIQNCFIPTSTIYYKDWAFCWDTNWFSVSESCLNNSVQSSTYGHIISGIEDWNKITDDNVLTACIGNGLVCCVYVEYDPNPCTSQPTFSLNGLVGAEYSIAGIECKINP